jgi:hypothetical protein
MSQKDATYDANRMNKGSAGFFKDATKGSCGVFEIDWEAA